MLRRVINEALRLQKCGGRWINADIHGKTTRNFPALQAVRTMSSSTNLPKVVNFQQVKTLDDDTLLIDVREPSELQQFGVLPKSINIPLGNVERAFKELSSEEFKKLYGCKKPDLTTSLVFSCKAGIRSAKAMKIVENLGYNNTSNYQGGFDDWLEKSQKS